MIRLWSRLDRSWYAPAPAERLAMLRVLVGAFALTYVTIRARHLAGYGDFPADQFAPVGIVALLPQPLPGSVVSALVLATILAGAAFVAGWRYRATGPLFAVLLLFVTTYRNSWGQVFHTENLMVLHTAVLALSPAADALSLDARGRANRADEHDGRYGAPIRLMCLLTVLSYMISGQTKLRTAGLDWITSDSLRNYIAYDNLRKAELGDPYSPLASIFVAHGWLFRPLAVFTLAVEIGAFVAILGRRAAKIWVLSAWLFHVGVLALMAILFPYPLLGLAFAPFFAVERLLVPVRSLRFRPATPAAAEHPPP